jgi:hypothetical protein
MDYGQELLFGTFITPAAQRPHHAVELAVVADRAGPDQLVGLIASNPLEQALALGAGARLKLG